jgi:hypothetical protein
MSGGMIQQLLQGMDSETASEILSSLDDDMIEQALETGIEQELVPHLETVRVKAAEEYEDPKKVREYYEGLDEDKQTEKFHKAAADLVGVAVDLRENPIDGLSKLKGRLRDPWTTEALLLIFNHSEIPEEIEQERKAFAATWMKYIGAHVIPEIYERDDVADMVEQMYPDREADEILDELGVEG